MNRDWSLNSIKTYDFFEYFDKLNTTWHNEFDAEPKNRDSFENIFFNLHFFNFSLWHEEDEARRKDVSDAMIARVKRNIDKFNQQRNDSIEQLDKYIVTQLKQQNLYKEGLPLNSETPGSIIDRLSIISLKVYHMAEQTRRTDATQAHLQACQDKLNTLIIQKNDLSTCLSELIADYAEGRKTMRVYFQFKMYNDPNLNPALYGNNQATQQD
ncbi:DUF4254 domain-containing protein [candidate division KSB1 bacterium]|nr:DUF4254 domain-containing protein [candidate division KSB1 bacterium]